MAQYPNSGKLSANRYKDAPNKPDLVGELVMDRSTLRKLLEETDSDDIVIKLGGWKMNGQYGEWTRLSWNNYKPKPKDNPYVAPRQDPPQPRAQVDSDDVPF